MSQGPAHAKVLSKPELAQQVADHHDNVHLIEARMASLEDLVISAGGLGTDDLLGPPLTFERCLAELKSLDGQEVTPGELSDNVGVFVHGIDDNQLERALGRPAKPLSVEIMCLNVAEDPRFDRLNLSLVDESGGTIPMAMKRDPGDRGPGDMVVMFKAENLQSDCTYRFSVEMQ